MNKVLILFGTFLISVALAVILVLALPGHYHLDETTLQTHHQTAERLDWTRSWDYPDQSLVSLIGQNLGYSLLLQCFSFLCILGFSFFLSLAALRWQKLIYPLEKLVAIGISAPALFWIPLLVYFFCIKLDVFPLRYEPSVRGWILPLLALSFRPFCLSTEILLSEWKKAADQSYFLVARSKGLSRIQVFYRHGLKNALIPFTTQMGNFLMQSIMGSVLVENLFSFPGIGLLLVEGLQNRDLPVVLFVTILFTFIMMVVYALVELLQTWLEPRADRTRA